MTTEAERISEAREAIRRAEQAIRNAHAEALSEFGQARRLLEPIAGAGLRWWQDHDDQRPITEAESLLQLCEHQMSPEGDLGGVVDFAEVLWSDLAETDADRVAQCQRNRASSERIAREFDEREAQARAAGVDLEALSPEDRRLFRRDPAGLVPALRQRRNAILAAAS